MLGKIVSGSSFKGAALYHLHDKRLEGEKVRLTDARVAWTETVNLRTSDPEKAWRIMVATAENQAALKQAAGMKMTGRKLTKPVYTYSLAWHPEQKPSQAEMLEAAKETLDVLKMDEHQALIVCHNDTAHPHVHVIVNRVHPETGLAAKTSQDRLKLSRWAEAYERAGGKIYCEERVVNNAKRDQGEFVKAESVPRQSFELAEAVKPALNDNREAAERIKEEQKQKDAALNQYGRDMAARHRTALGELAGLYRETKDEVTTSLRAEIAATKQALKEAQRPAWKNLYREQWKETQRFERQDQTLIGRVGHALQAGRLEGETRIGGFFRALVSAERRLAPFEAAQERARAEMGKGMRQTTRAAVDALRAEYRPIYQATYGEYQAARSQLLTRQQGERGQLKGLWVARHEDRRQALQQLRPEQRGAVPERSDGRIGDRDTQKVGSRTTKPTEPQRPSPGMKPPSEGRPSSPTLPNSALAALRKASAAVDQAQHREAKQQPKVDLQQGLGRTRKLE